MKKKKVVSLVLSGILIGGLMLTSGGSVVADDQTSDQTGAKTALQGSKFPGKGPGGFMGLSQDILDQLVADGVITQEQADKIADLIEARIEEAKTKAEEFKNLSDEERQALKDQQPEKRTDLFTQAVNEGIITQAEAEAIKDSIQEIAAQERLEAQQKQLDALVAAGTITQEQADQLLALAKTEMEEQKAKAEEFKSMTEEERQALLEEQKTKAEEFKNLSEEERQALKDQQKDKKADLYSQAVDAGIITQTECDAIHESMKEKAEQERQQNIQNKIDELVSQGTITSEQAATILENMSKKRQKAQEDLSTNTSTQNDIKDQKNTPASPGERPTPFKDLVDDGTLTQDQADSVGKALQPPGNRGGGYGGPGGHGGPGGFGGPGGRI